MDPVTLIVCLLAIIIVAGVILGRIDLMQALLILTVAVALWAILGGTIPRR